jgi:hypothetical protein
MDDAFGEIEVDMVGQGQTFIRNPLSRTFDRSVNVNISFRELARLSACIRQSQKEGGLSRATRKSTNSLKVINLIV